MSDNIPFIRPPEELKVNAGNPAHSWRKWKQKFEMGCSRKNPHLPDGWQTGNPGGRGGREGLEIQVGGGMQAKKFVFRGQFRGICKMKVEG